MGIRVALLSLLVIGGMGCEAIKDNEGSMLTTRPGQALKESMFIGKWDLDGERTNTANGRPGLAAIPSDIVKDIFGTGWKFEENGVMRTDATIGSEPGSWKLIQPDRLQIHEYDAPKPVQFKVHFQDGYMHLKAANNTWRVMEKSKFFGF